MCIRVDSGGQPAVSSFLYGLARSAYRRRAAVLGAWLAALVVIAGFAGVAGGKFEESFSLPGTESQTALDSLNRNFPQVSGTSAQVVIVTPAGTTVRDAEVRDAIEDSAQAFERVAGVDAVTLPYDEHVEGLISDDGQAAIMMLRLSADTGSISDGSGDVIVPAPDTNAVTPEPGSIALLSVGAAGLLRRRRRA